MRIYPLPGRGNCNGRFSGSALEDMAKSQVRTWAATTGRVAASVGCTLLIPAVLTIAAAWFSWSALAQNTAPDAVEEKPRRVTAVVPRSWPPQYQLDEDGKPAGFAIDVMNEIAARANLTVEYLVADNFAAAVEFMQRGDADLIPNSGILSQRRGEFAFTAPVETFVVSLFIRNESGHINGVADLPGQKLAVVEKNIGLFMFGKRRDMEVKVYRDVRTALFELIAGHVDALVYPQPVLLTLARQIGVEDRIRVAGRPLREVKRGIRVMKDNVGLLAVLNKAVEGFVGTPAYQRIYTRWYGRPAPFWSVEGMAWTMGGLLILTLIAMAWWRYRSVLVLNRGLRETIAERRKAQQALGESEEKYRDLIEGSLLAIQIVGKDGNRVYANQAFVDLLGYGTEEEVLALPVGAITDRSNKTQAITQLREVRTSGVSTPFIYEFDAHRKDGSIVSVQAFARSIVWEGNYAQQRTYIDLTERKRAERALRESEGRYRDLIEGSDLGVHISGRDGTRILTNRACAELFGYGSPDELLAIPRMGIIAQHDRDRVMGYQKMMFEDGKFMPPYEFDGVRKDGSIIPLQAFMRRIVWEGEDAIQRTFIDLTQRNKAEEQLRHAQKMEAIGQLTGGVAHDFNNLLTVIHGNLELIADRLEDPAVSRMAHSAIDAARRGAELTGRLLAFSRRQMLAPAAIDPDQLIAGMTELMRRTLGETVEIGVVTVDDLWRCEADPGQLENAILNLALNARDAMPQGGRLVIETANATLDDAGVAARHDVVPGEYLMISVSDTGTGMSPEVADHAIEPFFTTKDVGKGSGLGLSQVYGFISQSNGYVTIDSEQGVGTTVKLYLPRSAEQYDPAQQNAGTEDPVSQGEKVLVVEDDPDVRDLTVTMLTDLGYVTVEAADGKEAIEALKHTPGIDLLLTDVVLPGGMSGLDVAREAPRFIPDIKIIFTSGYAEHVLARHGEINADVQLINKPFRRDDVARKLRAALDNAAV